jgi:hypothetical protein
VALALARFLKDILPTWKFINLCKHFFHRCSDICFDNCNLLHCRKPDQKDERKKDRIDFISTDDSIGNLNTNNKFQDPPKTRATKIRIHSKLFEVSIKRDAPPVRIRLGVKRGSEDAKLKQEPNSQQHNSVKSADIKNRLSARSRTQRQ